MSPFEKLFKTKPIEQKEIQRKGAKYVVNYMPVDLMREARVKGYARDGQAFISEALDGSVKRFVTSHELYHLDDHQTWFGYFGKELRANVACGIKDPLGLMATVRSGLRSDSLGLYFKRMWRNNTTLTK